MKENDDNPDDLTKINNYDEYLDRFVTSEDKLYLEEDELARDVIELYSINKGEIRNESDFVRKKKEIEDMNKVVEDKNQTLLSLNMNYRKNSFLEELKKREDEVKKGRKFTIIYIRYKDKKGKETSAYIDFRDRLKTDEMKTVFQEGYPLLPKPSDLSYYNWSLQKVTSKDSSFFSVDAGPKERLSFKNNEDRKKINVDLEYLEAHPGLDVKRIPLNIKNCDGSKDILLGGQDNNKENVIITPVDVNKENEILKKNNINKEEEEKEIEDWGYQQIVIFDYEAKRKNYD